MMFKQAEFFGRICDQNWCGLGVVCDDDLVMFILQCPSWSNWVNLHGKYKRLKYRWCEYGSGVKQ